MMRINKVAVFFIALIALITVSLLVAKMAKIQPPPGVDSAKIGDIEEKRRLVWQYHNQGDEQSAIQAAEEYLKSAPDDKATWMILAENYLWTNKVAEAEKTVKKVLKLDPKYPWGLRTLASIYRTKAEQSPQLRDKYLSMAEAKVKDALKMAPDDLWVNLEAGRLYLAQKKIDTALQIVNKALEARPQEEHLLGLKKQILSKTE